MIQKVIRNYLEIKSIKDLKEIKKPDSSCIIELLDPVDFQLNKFLYKQIGNKYFWVDRLEWTDNTWIKYLSNKNLITFVLKKTNFLIGYFELILHKEKKESEVAYFGILEEYYGKKLGGYLLSEAIKKSFLFGNNRLWLHTCTLDNPNALSNYLSRGMKIFKSETISINIS